MSKRKKRVGLRPFVVALGLVALVGCEQTGPLEPVEPTYNFGEVLVGDTAESPGLSWRNGGNVTERVMGHAAQPEGGAFRAGGTGLPSAVLIVRPGGRTPPVTFVFAPQEGGPASGTGTLEVPSFDELPAYALGVRLRGIGRYSVTGERVTFPELGNQGDAPLDFGPVDVEAAGLVSGFQVLNVTPEPIEAEVTLRHGGRGMSLLAEPGPLLLPSRERVLVELQFAPLELGRHLDVVELRDPARDETLARLVVVGEGVSEGVSEE